MNADERQHQIVALARQQGEVEVAKLAAELNVSAETIRRDLRLLEKHGLLRRTHGGAYPVETAKFETDLAIRTTRGVPEKRRIAVAAAAIRRFSGTPRVVRIARSVSNFAVSTGYAPPCVRRIKPCFSSSRRSRRIVSAETSSSVASLATLTSPCRRANATI